MSRLLREIAWDESVGELYERYRAERDLQRRQRLHMLWLVRQGMSATAA